MVVEDSAVFLRKLLQFGAKITATVSCNPATQIEKIKVFANPMVQVDPGAQVCAAMVLHC